MNVTMKKTLASVLAVAAVAASLAGCSSSTSSTASSSTASAGSTASSQAASSAVSDASQESAEPAELSLCMSQIRWGISVDDNHMQQWVAELEKATNTKIEMIAPTHNDYMEKLNVLLASGDIPDIMIPQQAWDYVGQFAVRGYIQPLTQYVENDERFAVVKSFDNSIYQSGDDIYGIPVNSGNNKIFWFRNDMIEKYGLEIKETMTTDEFITELKKVDQSEAIPFSFPKHIVNFQIFYNAFGAYGGILPDENGVYYDGIQTQEMKDAFAFIKTLYDEGLMDAEFITNENSNMREKIYAGTAVSDVDYTSRYINYLQSASSVGAPTDFTPMYSLVGPNGDLGTLNESGNEAVCVSVDCENVDAAMNLVHYLFFTEEGRMLYTLGVEGVHYDIVDNVLTPREDAVAAGYAVGLSDLISGWAAVDIQSLGFQFADTETAQIDKNIEITNKANVSYVGPLIKIPMGKSTLYDENVATYNSNLYEMATKIVLGSQTIDEAYADYEQFWKSIQGDKMLEELNAQ